MARNNGSLQQIEYKVSPAPPTLTNRQKSYSKVIRGLMQVAAGLYELIFSEPAPRPTDALRG